MPNQGCCDQAEIFQMGDCGLNLPYGGLRCEEKSCRYAKWCPTCDKNPPPRRRRSRSETTETYNRRRYREVKTFTPKKLSRSSQEYENMEVDSNLLYYNDQQGSNGREYPHCGPMCELPTTYITNNCQFDKCQATNGLLSKVSGQQSSEYQKNGKGHEQSLKLNNGSLEEKAEIIDMMSEKNKTDGSYERYRFEKSRLNGFTKVRNECETLKSPSRPLCVPVHRAHYSLRSAKKDYYHTREDNYLKMKPNGYKESTHKMETRSFSKTDQFSCPSYNGNGFQCSNFTNSNCENNWKTKCNQPSCLSYDTCTFFDKKFDIDNLREKYTKEVEVLREKLAAIKRDSQSNRQITLPIPLPRKPRLEGCKSEILKSNCETKAEITRINPVSVGSKSKNENIYNLNSQGDVPKTSGINGHLKVGPYRRKGILSPPLIKGIRTRATLKTRGKVLNNFVGPRKIRSKTSIETVVSESTDSECSASDESEEEVGGNNAESSESVSECSAVKIESLSSIETGRETSLTITQSAGGDGVSPDWPLRQSLFPNVPPYIKFSSHDSETPVVLPYGGRHLKWKSTTITPLLVRKTLTNSGFVLVRNSNQWLGTWGKHMKSPCFQTLKTSQKLNHFPGTFQLGRKDRLWRNFQRLISKFGYKEFGFLPHTYILPQELRLLKQNWEFKNGAGGETWIIKPPASARGVGIKVINKWSQLPKKTSIVVQRYISNPYLINGSKFDLRLYVLVTSFNPLRIYLYPEGLARFASAKYSEDAKDLKDRYMHLTNFSINKFNSEYTPNEDADSCEGHKWTITKLFEIMHLERGVDTKALWKNLETLVIKTIITCEAPIIELCNENVNSRYNCYELFGIDVLLDERLKPWLLEVNISPSLHSASSLDTFVKGPMVQTLFDMAQYHFPVSLDLSRENAPVPPCYDPRLYTTALTKRERLKHAEFKEAECREEYLDNILKRLTGDDVRHLIQAEDEMVARGRFLRIFPTRETHRYLPFMEIRYYNRLFDAWETRYERDRQAGITILRDLCAQKVHLKVPPLNKMNKNMIPNFYGEKLLPSMEGQSNRLADVMKGVSIRPSNPSLN